MMQEIFNWTKEHMAKSIEALKRDFLSIRTGKVSAAILDPIRVDYYGTPTPISQVATIATPNATTITITPWEKPMLKEIEKAIQSANIGVNPGNNGEAVILSFPPMTSEQRQEGVKKAKAYLETCKVAIRNIRRDANEKIKKLEKEKAISEDEAKRAQDQIQKMTDEWIKKADDTFAAKEAEILKV
ncbi:MAG: ribosome recycling factor [Campylobacterales bacterium]